MRDWGVIWQSGLRANQSETWVEGREWRIVILTFEIYDRGGRARPASMFHYDLVRPCGVLSALKTGRLNLKREREASSGEGTVAFQNDQDETENIDWMQ